LQIGHRLEEEKQAGRLVVGMYEQRITDLQGMLSDSNQIVVRMVGCPYRGPAASPPLSANVLCEVLGLTCLHCVLRCLFMDGCTLSAPCRLLADSRGERVPRRGTRFLSIWPSAVGRSKTKHYWIHALGAGGSTSPRARRTLGTPFLLLTVGFFFSFFVIVKRIWSYVHPSVYKCLLVKPSTLFLLPSVHPTIYLSIYLLLYLSINQSVYLTI
jgi:hypothetical protein